MFSTPPPHCDTKPGKSSRVGGAGRRADRRFDEPARNADCQGGGQQVASYLGRVPGEESSGDRQRLGHISKQGNTLLRFLLVEAAQVTIRSDPEWRRKYFHLALRRGRKIAKVAMARRLALRLYWMWRKQWDYQQWKKSGPHAGQPGTGVGVQANTESSIWAARSSRGEFELAIMIERWTEEMPGSD